MQVELDGVAVNYTAHQWISMSDGVRLSAASWMPGRLTEPLPALIEIIPYRKRDHTAVRDFQMHSALAARGYACFRVDMRGHGDSEGLHDAHRTYADVEEIVAWLRSQPWCSGRIGMVGLSWGGTNAFLAASRRIEGLDAIITNASSHDRYGVGMLWKNGCLLNENFGWVSSLSAFATRPPDPAIVGDAWRDIWMNRLQQHQPEAANMLARQRRDAYWDDHVAEAPEQWRAAVYMFSGWADNNYAQTPPTLLPALRKAAAVLGPWGHRYPHQGFPGPAIDFVSEAVRWFDQHLKDRQPDAPPDPLTLFVSQNLPARPVYEQAPGRWVALDGVPEGSPTRQWHLAQEGRLLDRAEGQGCISHCSPLAVGTASGEVMPWFAAGPAPELPADQRDDDAGSMCFDSATLENDVEYIGRPTVELLLSVDRPVASLAIRLCDIKPDGSSARVTLGLFNLNRHADTGGSERHPCALEPGRQYRVRFSMDFAAYRFLKGHRIRLAISTSYWPMVWPNPEPVTLRVACAGSSLRLPLSDAAALRPARPLGTPAVGASIERRDLQPVERAREVTRDHVANTTRMLIRERVGPYTLPAIDWTVASRSEERYSIRDDDPSTASASISIDWRYARDEWSATTNLKSSLTADRTSFKCRIELHAAENDKPVFSNTWTYEIPRDFL